MKAAMHRTHGTADVLAIETVADPVPGPGEVLVAVRAAGLNRLDVLQRAGPALVPGFTLPHIAGTDVAGEIVAVGEGVDADALVHARVIVNPALPCGRCAYCARRPAEDRFCTDPLVVGGNRPGGYAELTVAPAAFVHPIPVGVEYTEAAAIPTTWATAWKGLVGTGRLQAGETVVIHAAGSGVSVAAIQIAKSLGAIVVATAGRDEKLKRALDLGADIAINNRRDDLVAATLDATAGNGADMVFDHAGPALIQASLFSLRPRGRMVFCGTTTGVDATFNLAHAYHSGLSLLGVEPFSSAEFAEVLEFYWEGGFDPVIDSVLPLAEVREAQRRMERGELFGKIILCP
jgi:NADPH:quinone reductase-like Zn-dependent oxidoreductase